MKLPAASASSQAQLEWGSKAETLERVSAYCQQAKVLPQIRFSAQAWQADPASIFKTLAERGWLDQLLIVRSSALSEDRDQSSLAGHFSSVLNVTGQQALEQAIAEVIASFESTEAQDGHQVFIQPQLQQIALSGVAFSRDPNTGSPYAVINYDDHSGSTDSVTSGRSNNLRTFYHFHQAPLEPPSPLNRIVRLLQELCQLFNTAAIDIEFALDQQDQLWLLQVRPLVVAACSAEIETQLTASLQSISHKISALNRPHPYLQGEHTVFGIMPDWNPAEMIGVRPGILARSLYQELITDNIWAYQRHNYGYRNLRSFPLLQSLGGCPYIDVRLSFNSFVPANLPAELASRLVQYYLERLVAHPSYHDKVEFEIIFSCYTLDLPERLQILRTSGFNQQDCEQLANSLRQLTNQIIHAETGLWKQDIAKIHELERRQQSHLLADLDLSSRVYWLLEDAKRYGTLPFAGLARAGFIAVQMLRSLVSTQILSQAEYGLFMSNLDTVSSRIGRDLAELSQSAFLRKYGHLRPGTYDLLSARYDETPERYFDWTKPHPQPSQPDPFVLSLSQLKAIERMLQQHQLDLDVIGLFDFIKEAIEGREYAKFVFTRNLSDALRDIAQLAEQCGLSLPEAANIDIASFKKLYTSSLKPAEILQQSAASGAEHMKLTRHLVLPPLITRAEDIWSFELQQGEPNFITLKRTIAATDFIRRSFQSHQGKILLIDSADPGYDWVFAHHLAGLITCYGGANSHMAIRAGELGIPAVIGAGEVLYQRWSQAQVLELDCANHQVRILQ